MDDEVRVLRLDAPLTQLIAEGVSGGEAADDVDVRVELEGQVLRQSSEEPRWIEQHHAAFLRIMRSSRAPACS
ncbi:MAG: hypothetical protein M9894_16870 [Planctomycetes bacterium]|nr:hypothetical protein [Planctomycetota bacterium]